MAYNLSTNSRKTPMRILFETGEGRSASAFLENNFLQHCLDLGAEVHVLSPGACYEPFVESYRLPGTEFYYLSMRKAKEVRNKSWLKMERRLENWFTRLKMTRHRDWLWKIYGARAKAADAAFLNDIFNKIQPDCFVTAHLNQGFSRGLIAKSYCHGIPTLGNVFSWDHPFYLQPARPDRLTCWSEFMRENLVKNGGFLPEQIKIIGAPAFDPYFDPDGMWSRREFCEHMGLDPGRPILLFATLGQLEGFMDETGTFKAFLDEFDRAALPGPPQIVLRLHPISVDHYYDAFRSRKDIIFSRYSRYCPGIRWWPSYEEIIFAGNLMRHADVCISPGSTMTVEAAIFDTPTIIPAFNPYLSDDYDRFFQQHWLKKHFRYLVEEKTIGLAYSPEELIITVQRALADRSWLAEGRRKIREHLLGPLDGRATERLARIAVECAGENAGKQKI